MKRIGILASGGGTTANYIATEVIGGNVPDVEIACAISSLSKAGVIGKMQEFGIPTEVVRVQSYPGDSLGFGKRMLEILEAHGVTDVFQWGWMPHTPPNVVERFRGHIFNAHPGPLPEFGGDKMAGTTVHQTVLNMRDMISDVTGREMRNTIVVAHRVTDDLDAGPVVHYGSVPILPDDTADTLKARALLVEYRVQLETLRQVANGTVRDNPHPSILEPGEDVFLREAKRLAIVAAAKH